MVAKCKLMINPKKPAPRINNTSHARTTDRNCWKNRFRVDGFCKKIEPGFPSGCKIKIKKAQKMMINNTKKTKRKKAAGLFNRKITFKNSSKIVCT
jgi:hypothetical protein